MTIFFNGFTLAKAVVFLNFFMSFTIPVQAQEQQPNILIVISDDQSLHASGYGTKFVETPAFDRVAGEGILFMNGWAPSPSCTPSRAGLLTGRFPWQLEDGSTLGSSLPSKYVVFPDLLEEAGYWVGFTGKGWAPGDVEASSRDRNPAGPAFQEVRYDPPHQYISNIDYAGNFRDFLEKRPADSPFYFWLGTSEPHRTYEQGIGLAAGKRLEDVDIPNYLPDVPEVRSDLLDYAIEIEWFDQHLAQVLALLEEQDELDKTLIIVTSDQGMPFPRAKTNLYRDGLHIPLAIRWGERVPGGRVVDDLVNLVDLMPTILEAAGVNKELDYPITGQSIMELLISTEEGILDPSRDATYAGRERHASARWRDMPYPQRAIRTHEYLYIRNYATERWPAGAPMRLEDGKLTPMHSAYHDIDASPTLKVMTDNADDPYFNRYLHLSVGLRPAEELYNILKDPGCLNNLAMDSAYEPVTRNLRNRLNTFLEKTGDPRVSANGDIFESYPKLTGPLREFPAPEWAFPLLEEK